MVLNNFNLAGKTAIVTGCNTGLGQGMALALAEAGADVVGVNVSDPGDTKAGVEKLGRRFLDLRANLADAGIIRREDAIKFSEADWDDVMDLNLKSVFFLSQAVAKVYLAQGTGGKIINIASMLSFQGGVRVPSYTASKSGVMGITRLMANEWAAHGINVNAIAPGYMATNNTAALRADEQRNSAILERIPAGRWGKPEDLAGPVVFLASQASDYVNGYTVAVDGGWLAR
ncbi:MAG: SDR family oxidoreductase [Burkholderiales bacterium]|nr:SDR family oxidoreductase [Burkholderiales bacterium]